MGAATRSDDPPSDGLTLCLTGDVMTGRGVDQVLPRSVDPRLHERFVRDARRYVELAEEANGPIPAPVDHPYVWGDALEELGRAGPDALIVNLETAVTARGRPWTGKGIHYRMHPGNVPLLTAADVDACVLANNHVLDWGRSGLSDTMDALRGAGLATAGAGEDREEACSPAVLETGRARVLVVGFGSAGAGIPRSWAAEAGRPGVCLLPDLSGDTARDALRHLRSVRREDDLVVASIHWGGNWGYRVPERQRRFARTLVEAGAADVVHGHSSHHPRGTEVHDGRPILYGCGDFINDYEGISGHREFRPELVLLYLVTLEPGSGRLTRFEAVPFRLRRFRLERAAGEAARWLAETLDRESRELGARVDRTEGDRLRVRARSVTSGVSTRGG